MKFDINSGCYLILIIQHLCYIIFFSIWVFFHDHSRITVLQEEEKATFLTPHYHFHPLQRHLDISRAITAGSSSLHTYSSRNLNRQPLVSKRKSLTTKLSALKKSFITNYKVFLTKLRISVLSFEHFL